MLGERDTLYISPEGKRALKKKVLSLIGILSSINTKFLKKSVREVSAQCI